MNGFLCHVLIGTCQGLQCFVWMWISLATQDSLYSLSHYCPCIVQIFLQLLLVQDELAQALQGALNSNHTMPQRNTDVAKNRTVGQVTLQTAYWQLLSQELKNGIGNTQVTLTVLEVDRIYLMGHSAGTYLTCLDFLLEVLHGDIHPEVTIQIDDDGVDTTNGIKDGTQIVVIANLSSILFTLQAQLFTDELVAECLPVELWISYVVGIVVASSTTKLGSDLAGFQRIELFCETIDIHHDFLTQTSRRSWLSVSLCQHWNILPLISIGLQLSNEFLYLRIVHLFQRLLHRERYTGIVDILRCKTEMDKFLISIQASDLIKFFLNKILDCLHIVIGYFFNILHTLCLVLIKITIDVTQTIKKSMVK